MQLTFHGKVFACVETQINMFPRGGLGAGSAEISYLSRGTRMLTHSMEDNSLVCQEFYGERGAAAAAVHDGLLSQLCMPARS